MISSLAAANQAFQKGQTTNAMTGYVNALLKMPELGKAIAGNVSRTRKQYLKSSNKGEPLKVVVCGWELAHNAAGRAHTLAEIYREITSDVEIVGSIFPRWGTEVWEPIRETSIPIHAFVVEPDRFIEQGLSLVAAHPADVVHLSKPRAPNIFFGIFYKILWGAKVIVDIDDEELAFVKAETPLSLSEYLEDYEVPPPLDQLTDAHWTRIAVGLVSEFDAITVSNSALQRRYGGLVVGHARDPKAFKPSPELRKTSRQALGIRENQKVVLFSGTPRPHKGLLGVAKAIQSLNRDDIVFVIAGSFGERYLQFKADLQALKGVKYVFCENQPISTLPSTLAIADCCVLFQDTDHPVSKFQIPAKLGDALAMRVPVIVSSTDAVEDPIAVGAVAVTGLNNLAVQLVAALDCTTSEQVDAGHRYFLENLTTVANAVRLEKLLKIPVVSALSLDLSNLLENASHEYYGLNMCNFNFKSFN
jgi:glycosyltransferase involved in cell wall biosynthesis